MTSSPPNTAPGPVAGPAVVIERWRAEVAADGAPDTLLWRAAAAAIDLTHAHPAGIAKLLSGRSTRLTELFREPTSRTRALHSARAVRRKELELDREHGLPGCYLLAGTATWAVADTADDAKPAAPVFLRRCRVRPLDASGADYAVDAVGEMSFNPVLRERLSADFGIQLDAAELTRISRLGNGFDPTGAFAALTDATRSVPGWALQRTLRVTTVHLARAAAVADFERSAPRLGAHPVLGRLLVAAATEGGAARDTGPESLALPANPDEPFVLDADPPQVAVLEQVRDGVSLVIDAGPGTGKSQTIVNLAADLARVGARTLVAVPSRPGRASIAGRLDHLGLAHLLHEPRLDQSPWLSVRTASPPHVATPSGEDDPWPTWSAARETLHSHVVRMHGRRRPWGVSLDEIQSRLVELTRAKHPPRSKVRIGGSALAALDADAREHWRGELTRVAEQSAWSFGVDDDPWWGADIDDASAQDDARAALDALSPSAFASLDATFDEVFAGVAVPALPTLGHYRDFVAEMAGIGEVLAVFRLGIFDAPLDQLIATGAGTRERWRVHRALRGLLRPGASPEQGQALLDRARALRPLWLRVRASDVLPAHITGLDRAQDAYAALAAPLGVLQARLARPADAPALLDLPLAQLPSLISRLDATRARLDVLPRTRPTILAAREAGLGDLVDDLAQRAVPADQVGAEVDLVWWSSVLQAVTAADPGYATARGDALRAAAGSFRAADAALQRQIVADLASAATPTGPPIVLTSPRAAAMLLDEDAAFDVVVIDEAHALTPAIVAAVLARAPQAVIVGDSRMPRPRGFTACAGARLVEEGEPESLLDLAARVLPVHCLPWHYTSRDQRLVAAIEGSYAGLLVTTPAPRSVRALTCERVIAAAPREEVADPAGEAVADPAAEAVADPAAEASPRRRALAEAAAERAVEWTREGPDESLAVIASSARLARLVAGALRAGTGQVVPLAAVADDGPEPLAVLDPEGCAAEVRDAVIVVLDADASDVEPRLLTAVVSRARSRMLVLHSFPPGESTGSPLLDALLAAGAGAEVAGGAPGSVLVDDFARRLRARGLIVVTSYGAQPAIGADGPALDGSVDLAVRDPFAKSGPMVAVELDGLRYARAGGIRMRERLRLAQLHRLGWRVIHVASVDLFRDPAREVARIAGAIEGLRADRPQPAARPEQTRDDTAAGWGETPDERSHDRWLRDNRPPHWHD
ncbi:MAG: hypothetical protein V9G19_23415 [Tetrasphaera sp.]